MLGVRRPTVTLVMADLVRQGIVRTSRGMIDIVDCDALEALSCECYRVYETSSTARLTLAVANTN